MHAFLRRGYETVQSPFYRVAVCAVDGLGTVVCVQVGRGRRAGRKCGKRCGFENGPSSAGEVVLGGLNQARQKNIMILFLELLYHTLLCLISSVQRSAGWAAVPFTRLLSPSLLLPFIKSYTHCPRVLQGHAHLNLPNLHFVAAHAF